MSRPELQQLLWSSVGIQREADQLQTALGTIASWRPVETGDQPADRMALENMQMTRLAWLMATAALRREESRGAHYRRDFPGPVEAWRRHQVWSRAD